MSIEPFEIHIPQATLDDLALRLAEWRPVPEDHATDWDAGMSPAYLAELVAYWRDRFDWRAREKELNRFSHYRATIGGKKVHFIRQPGRGESPMPLLLTHGYPDSFLRFLDLIPLLTEPELHGADPADAFDVVVPSLPGYAFSDPPDGIDGIFHTGSLWHRLMTDELGYDRYAAHGGDWGSTVTEHLARSHAGSVIGIHLTDIPFWHGFQKPDDPTPAEAEYLKAIENFPMEAGAYAMIQGTRPQTIADGLNDSPAGLAAWMVEKFQRWSDCGGSVETRFSKDQLLSNVMLYWATDTVGTSLLPYAAFTHASAMRWIAEKAKEVLGSDKVPAGFAKFPKDLTRPPRDWGERFFNVQRWTEMPRGGHFGAMEEPELLAEDIRAFFRPLRERDPVVVARPQVKLRGRGAPAAAARSNLGIAPLVRTRGTTDHTD